MGRADGKLLRHTDPMYRIAAHVMAKRSDSMNNITLDIPTAPIDRYLRQKKREGTPVSHMAVIMAAYVRTICEFPALNRFIVNKRAYARNEIAVGMVVLRGGHEDTANGGTMSKLYFQPTDTIFDVEERVQKYVSDNRNQEKSNSTDDLIAKLVAIPGLLRFAVNLLKFGDRHNLLPKSIIDASPFHCSLVFTNLKSIRTNHIHHHAYDFGTTSVVMAAGNSREVPRRRGGEIVHETCMPLGVVMDERICSGSYFAMAFRSMKKYLEDPSLLETPPAEVKPDPEL
ncbi:MAG: 2-oxo acid dehydrogenase subunit E2 [Ruminococcaceae bacterium]|nr:2-oxo acid dehydrogenase subunit E2 [Oscillospiraceae bacterium]